MMTYLDILIHEYHHTLRSAVWQAPLTAYFALFTARRARMGIDCPGFADQAADKARGEVKKHLAENYTVS